MKTPAQAMPSMSSLPSTSPKPMPPYTSHNGLDYLKAMVGTSAAILALTACSGMTRQEQGTAAGAVIGGVAGHVVGGGLLGTAAGAAVGGVVGHELTKKK